MNHEVETLWTLPTVIGVLCAAAEAARIPARPWALGAALDVLWRDLPDESRLRGCLDAERRVDPHVGAIVTDVSNAVHGLVVAGALRPEGRGWAAGYDVDNGWVYRHRLLLGSVPDQERTSLAKGASRLQTALTNWSKKSDASRLSSPATI